VAADRSGGGVRRSGQADRFAEACVAAIRDPWLRGLPLVGTVDQFVDSTDVLAVNDRSQHLRAFYDRIAGVPKP